MTTKRSMRRLFLVTLGLLAAAAAQPGRVLAQSAPASFNPLVNVSNTAAQVSDLAAVTLDGNTIYVACFTCADALSGVDACGPTPQVISEEGSNLSRTGVVTDRAGNTAKATAGGVNLDKTAPAVTCSNSAPALSPPNHKLVAVQTTVTVTDGLSGLLGFTLLRATSNEPDNGRSGGHIWARRATLPAGASLPLPTPVCLDEGDCPN